MRNGDDYAARSAAARARLRTMLRRDTLRGSQGGGVTGWLKSDGIGKIFLSHFVLLP